MSIQWLDISSQCLDMSKWCLDISVMPMVLSMEPLHSLGHNDQMTWNMTFSHVMPLVPIVLSCDANCIINGTILFNSMKKIKKKCHMTWSCDAVGTSKKHHMPLMALSMALFCWLGEDDWNKVQLDYFGHLMTVLMKQYRYLKIVHI